MNRTIIRLTTLSLALVCCVAAGCAKNQVRQEGSVTPQSTIAEAEEPETVTTRIVETRRPETVEARPSWADVSASTARPVAPERGLSGDTVMGLQVIRFPYDQAILTAEAREILEANARYLKQVPHVFVRIEGHCDERGTTEYNMALGERRARNALQFLADLGVAPDRMSLVTYGEESPADPRHNEEAWAKNRRAEFVGSEPM